MREDFPPLCPSFLCPKASDPVSEIRAVPRGSLSRPSLCTPPPHPPFRGHSGFLLGSAQWLRGWSRGNVGSRCLMGRGEAFSSPSHQKGLPVWAESLPSWHHADSPLPPFRACPQSPAERLCVACAAFFTHRCAENTGWTRSSGLWPRLCLLISLLISNPLGPLTPLPSPSAHARRLVFPQPPAEKSLAPGVRNAVPRAFLQ